MSIEEMEVKQIKQGCGFTRPVQKSMEAVKFTNGKIAYLSGEDVYVAYDEKSMVNALKQESGCIEVQVIHKV